MSERTQVGIVGAGPAGLLLGRLLELAGVENVVVEARDRPHVEARQRAGILEQGTIDVLEQVGVGKRMHAEGFLHDGIELLSDGRVCRIDFAALCGRQVALWPQTEVVKDLIAQRVDGGAPLHFEVTDVAVDPQTGVLTYTDADAQQHDLHCELIAGCDGFHGVCRQAVEVDVVERAYPFGWLGILAHAKPSSDELIYASSDRGFALASQRTAEISRLYIQVAPDEAIEDWPDDRIWEELGLRLARDGFTLNSGEIFDKSVTPMRSFVAAPMQHDKLVLAGDAAHIVPPTGAKGLNLAVADVRLLAEAMTDGGLETYSQRALRRVWRAEHFSWWMTSMLHRFPDHDGFDRALQQAQLDQVFTSESAQRTLAENYTGIVL